MELTAAVSLTTTCRRRKKSSSVGGKLISTIPSARLTTALTVVYAAGLCLELFGSSTALADRAPERFDRTGVRCLWLPRIASSTGIDDSTILFYMRGGKVYRNSLQTKCPGLGPTRTLAFHFLTANLCSTDTVTVLGRYGGTCRLGYFYRITKIEASNLLEGPSAVGQPQIQVKAVELPPSLRLGSEAKSARSTRKVGESEKQ